MYNPFKKNILKFQRTIILTHRDNYLSSYSNHCAQNNLLLSTCSSIERILPHLPHFRSKSFPIPPTTSLTCDFLATVFVIRGGMAVAEGVAE